LERRL